MKRDPAWGFLGFEFYLFRKKALALIGEMTLDERFRIAIALRLLADLLERHPFNPYGESNKR